MTTDMTCERTQIELSIAHDEGRPIAAEALAHVEACHACRAFADNLKTLDRSLARNEFHLAPDVVADVIDALAPRRRQWWSVAAAALVGLLAGAVIGGVGTRLETSQARDLDELFHTAGTSLQGLTANLLVVERGLHQEVPERVYVGAIDYGAPEQLAIELVDTTDYPDNGWVANDVQLTVSNGEMRILAGSPCPMAGMPDCLTDPSVRAFRDVPPFDNGVLLPLEIVGPGRSLTWPGGLEVLGHQTHQGRSAIQVRSTVAAVDLVAALVDHGAWRDFHPTDPVVMWLDEVTLVPLRLEVFPADSPERELWQLRRGYDDDLGGHQPILIVELSDLVTEPPEIELDTQVEAVSNGFVDMAVELPRVTVPSGFVPHRSGHRPLGEGGLVEVTTWSDGRSWLMIETTDDWDEPRLFGMSLPFVRPTELGDGSVGYMAPSGNKLAIHGEDVEMVVAGSVPPEILVEVAASLEIRGVEVPETWLEASTVDVSDLPAGTLAPRVEGWFASARVDEEVISILLSSGASRNILIIQREGTLLDPPAGPDVYEVEVRDMTGRYDASTGALEWVEDGRIVALRSDAVGMDALVEVADSMETR